MLKLMRHNPLLLKLGVRLCRTTLRMIMMSCRIRIKGLDSFIAAAKNGPTLLILWHSHLAIIADILFRYARHYDYAAFISNSRDGEPLALLTSSYPRGHVIRVPHNSRHFALKEAIEFLAAPEHILIVTPDGPRGPAKQAKPGVVAAAIQAKATIVPFGWKSTKTWQLNTWDGMLLPKPFSTLEICFGEPIQLNPKDSTSQHMEIVTASLNSCTIKT